MKIFLSGAQGTGKSTIISSCSLNLKTYDSYSKKFLSFKTKNTQLDFDSSEFLDFQYLIFTYCTNIYINEDNFISSRGLADTYAYVTFALRYCTKPYNIKGLKEILKILPYYIEILKRQKEVYYFYTPVEYKITSRNNPLRITCIDYQKKIEALILSFYKKYSVLYFTVSGSKANRIKQIKEVISS